MRATLQRLLELQQLLLAFSQVDRRTHRKHETGFILENDTEHSYNLAMTAWFLASSFPDLNKDLLIQYALVHDLVEVHAGDTYIYGTADELSSKADREAAALQQLEREWPDFRDMTAAIHAYEQKSTPESRFVYALDKVIPIMLSYIHDGYTWKKEGVTADMLHAAKRDRVLQSPEILPYYDELFQLLISRPDLIKRS